MIHAVGEPLLTEHTLALATRGWYTFRVDLKSNKKLIAQEVSSRYKVTVVDVRTSRMHGKTRRVGKRSNIIRMSNWKKAIVRLALNQRIEVFEGVTEAQK